MLDDEVSSGGSRLQASGLSAVSEAVIHKRQFASEIRAWPGLNGESPEASQARADHLETEADLLSDISAYSPAPIVVGTGGEVVPDAGVHRSFCDTMRGRPSSVAADASHHRTSLAKASGVAAMALDAAETIQAANSLEKMMAHQIAAAHNIAMRLQAMGLTLLAEFERSGRQNAAYTIEAARLLNVSGRMMETGQHGVLALHRLRHSGRQVMVVQHVHINDGGQAVVAGQMKARGRSKKTAEGIHKK